jgi:hypothetical protein
MYMAYYCLILTKAGMCQQILVEFPGTKFHENLFSSSVRRITFSEAFYDPCLNKWMNPVSPPICALLTQALLDHRCTLTVISSSNTLFSSVCVGDCGLRMSSYPV